MRAVHLSPIASSHAIRRLAPDSGRFAARRLEPTSAERVACPPPACRTRHLAARCEPCRARPVGRSSTLATMERVRCWAEIDLDAFESNLDRVVRAAGADTRVLLVVKADAYGHGATTLALAAAARGIDDFCVATVDEAVELRRAGIGGRILLLGTLLDEEAEAAVAHGVEIGAHSTDRCRSLDALARRRGTRVRVHLNVDTGMGRLGVSPERAFEIVHELDGCTGLELAGLMTHVAACDGLADPRGREQLERFDALCARLVRAGRPLPLVHAANSATLFTAAQGPRASLPALSASARLGVRPGIATLGMLPERLVGAVALRPVLSLFTRVVFFKDVPAGTAIGYDSTWTAERHSRIATLPIGYHDGLAWRAGNGAHVLVRGRRAPIVGRVSMDYTTIDVTDVPGVEVGDEVVVLGRQGAAAIDALELAQVCGTIPYEVTCQLGRRVPRLSVRGARDASVLVPIPRATVDDGAARSPAGAGAPRSR